MKRDQFTFYRSYYEALKHLPKKDRADVLMAVIGYALDQEDPKLSGVPFSVFTLIRPTLDSGRNKARNRSKKTVTPEEQPGTNAEQTENKTGTNAEQNRKEGEKEREVEGEKEREYENECYPPTPLLETKGPTLEQVTEFARLRRSSVDPKTFFDYYAAAQWRDREGAPVRNWQQKFISWELRESQRAAEALKKRGVPAPPRPPATGPMTRVQT